MRNRAPTRASGNGARKLSHSPTRENGVRKNRSPTRAPGNGVRKLSSSPTRSSAPEQRNRSASPPPPPPPPPRWLILDRIVHRSRRHCGVVDNDATASALALDCVDRPIRASLRIAAPPEISRLYLHRTGRPMIDFAEPKAIAADGNAILFRMRVPFDDPDFWSALVHFPIDYFVYSCSSSSSSPATLTLLPPCFEGGHTNPKSDKYFKPHRFQQQRTMLDEGMGILCHGDQGEFTVADLTDCYPREVDLCLLHHPPPGSAIPIQWRVKRLQIPDDMKINLSTWRNDLAVPIGGRRMCWVDYYQGLLLIDVLTDSHPDHHHQKLLQFMPLPSQALKYRRPYRDADEPDPFRSVCVTDAGNIKLVCILTELTPSPSPSFTIITWILHNVHGRKRKDVDTTMRKDVDTTMADSELWEWRKDLETKMTHTEFFSLLGTAGQSCLPLVQPSFPTVSLVDQDVICFLLKDEDRGLFWMIEVNMKNKKLQSSALYINEEEEEGYPPKRARNNFFAHNFIRSKFSSFLSEDAITSCELSQKMQEAIKERVMQKIGLEAKLKK